MELAKLYKAVLRSDRFIYDHYTLGHSAIEDVIWAHNPPKIDMLVWAKQYPGAMTLRPDNSVNGIHIYASRDEEIWKVEYSVWYDGKESDLTVSMSYHEDNQLVCIDDLHVM